MNEFSLRKELYDFYLHGDKERSMNFADKCFSIMDERFEEGMSIAEQKMLQYEVITDEFTPVIFPHSPIFFETGVLTSLSDGAREAKSHSFIQANGWVYKRNCHLFKEQNEALYEKREIHIREILYLICGPYNDVSQHFNFNLRPILEKGLKGIYEKAKEELKYAKNKDEEEFLNSVCKGMLCLKKMAEKFSLGASEMLKCEKDEECRKNLSLISDTASRVPWNAPETLYEALCTVAFMRKALGSLEGVGPNTFGRLDKDLYPFYISGIKKGVITPDEAHDLISHFLLIWDCHYDHDMKMEGYSDHELENTYTLGGCDEKGNVLYNEVTKMFLKATREYKIIFPKITCRISKNSPKEYLDEINKSIIKGTTTVIIQNDDATIPAIERAGRPFEEAFDYAITGCWGIATNQEKYDHGSYMNLLKSFEIPLHKLTDKMKEIEIDFKLFDDCKSFGQFYETVLENARILIEERLNVTRGGGQIFHKVDRLPIFSSTLENCLETHRDYTMGGAKYNDDYLLMFGFPNIIDSLLAIKALVYDQKKYTLDEYLHAIRSNWEEFEDMRQDAIRCPGWGDGSEESCALAKRFNDDLFAICQKMKGTYGGKVHMGHLTYTEIIWWGEKTLALPDGRRSGEYFAQGLTPSRLKKIPNACDVIHSLSSLDPSTLGSNSVVNIILPDNITLDICEAFLKSACSSALQSLQLNCVSKEKLQDAQKHPEKYPDLIVRVTGFSAKFTSLSKRWQEEVISRNFYKK